MLRLLLPLHPALHCPGRQDRCSAARMRPCSRRLHSRQPGASEITVCSGLFVSAALWSLPGAAPFPARPCLPPDHNLRAWRGLVCCQLAPFVPREPGTSRQGMCRAGLLPRGSACGRLSLPSRAQGCAQWSGPGRSPPPLSCTPLLASELGRCPLGRDSGVQRTEACPRPAASAIVLSRILSQQSWALRRSPRVYGEGFPRAGQL